MSEERSGPRLSTLAGWALIFGSIALWTMPSLQQCGDGHPQIGGPAPALEGELVAGEGASAGDRVSLEALRGQVVLLDFWASWCGPCRMSAPILSRVAERHGDAGLVTLGVNVEEGVGLERVVRAHRAFGSTFPTLHDRNGEIGIRYRISALPTWILIDRQGNVRYREAGVPIESWLDSAVAELLAEGGGP